MTLQRPMKYKLVAVAYIELVIYLFMILLSIPNGDWNIGWGIPPLKQMPNWKSVLWQAFVYLLALHITIIIIIIIVIGALLFLYAGAYLFDPKSLE